MPGKIVRKILLDDVDTGSATTWQAAYPSQFPTTNDVPEWCYKSITNLLFDSPTEAQDGIVARYGVGTTLPEKGIEIALISRDSAEASNGMRADWAGFKVGLISIIVRKSKPDSDDPIDDELVFNVHKRLEILLDVHARGDFGWVGDFPTTAQMQQDPSVDADFSEEGKGSFYLRYLRDAKIENAIEGAVFYEVNYRLAVLRKP